MAASDEAAPAAAARCLSAPEVMREETDFKNNERDSAAVQPLPMHHPEPKLIFVHGCRVRLL